MGVEVGERRISTCFTRHRKWRSVRYHFCSVSACFFRFRTLPLLAACPATSSHRRSSPPAGISATYHFTFTGDEQLQVTIVVRDKRITIEQGHVGKSDLHVMADTKTWIGFLRKERSIVWATAASKDPLKRSIETARRLRPVFSGVICMDPCGGHPVCLIDSERSSTCAR